MSGLRDTEKLLSRSVAQLREELPQGVATELALSLLARARGTESEPWSFPEELALRIRALLRESNVQMDAISWDEFLVNADGVIRDVMAKRGM